MFSRVAFDQTAFNEVSWLWDVVDRVFGLLGNRVVLNREGPQPSLQLRTKRFDLSLSKSGLSLEIHKP